MKERKREKEKKKEIDRQIDRSDNDKDRKRVKKKCTGNGIGDEGARMISEALKSNNTLTTLYLGSEE